MTARPITLLCLSDLHIKENTDVESAFQSFSKQLYSYAGVHSDWLPDYIVIAGDLVEGKDKSPNKYQRVSSFIDEVLKQLRLRPERVIIVPGNHDKEADSLKSENKSGINDYLNNFNLPFIKDENVQNQFRTLFSAFNSFSKFYSPYVKYKISESVPPYHYEWDKSLLGDDLDGIALTSGIKVFDEDKICFICINTEWTYSPNESKVRICAPLVTHAINRIIHKYPDYLVVTVMHRNPAEFDWKERNILTFGDVLQDIYRYSDVILTGHDHNYQLFPPDLMANSSQLFRLGSISRNGNTDEELVPYSAAIIRINPLAKNIQVLRCERIYGAQVNWRFEPLGVYPIKGIYRDNVKEPLRPISRICVRTLEDKEVERDICLSRLVAKDMGSYNIICYRFGLKSNLSEQIDNSLSSYDLTHVVIYCYDEAMVEQALRLKRQLIEQFDSYYYAIQLVVEVVIISFPINAKDDRTMSFV